MDTKIELPLQEIFEDLCENKTITKIEIGNILRENHLFTVNILQSMIKRLREEGVNVLPNDED